MDMKEDLGAFAADLESSKSWVMNVVPTISDKSTFSQTFAKPSFFLSVNVFIIIIILF